MAMLNLDLSVLTAGLETYAWVLLRVSGFMIVAPIFGSTTIAAQVRVVITIFLTLMLAPLVPATPRLEPFSSIALLTALQQVLIGFAIATVVQVVFDALLLAGQAIATTMGLGFAMLVDPNHGAQTVVVGQFFLILGTLLFIAMDAHIALLGVLADSFRWLPPGPESFDPPGFATIATWGGKMFEAGTVIALPAIVGLLLVNLALGVISRAAPQLNLFAVGFPVSMLLGFAMLMLSLPSLQDGFERLVTDALAFGEQLAVRR
jgi:flagellar biosynthetic protein FliR